ncbi:MAG: hypothetical protein LQ346_006843, partial [Caloplaca aetnensis]
MPTTTTATTTTTPPETSSQPTTPTTQPINNTPSSSSLLSPRSGRQIALYALSSTLLTLSVLATRRALLRRYASTAPA